MDQAPQNNRRNRQIIGVAAGLGLVGLAACAVLVVLVLGVLFARSALRAPEPPLIPVTGVETPTNPPPALDTAEYLNQVESTLVNCYVAFNDFFHIEQSALDDTSLFVSEQWRSGAQEAAEQFRDACARLHDLPDAPGLGYDELDEMLRLSADQAAEVERSFSGVLAAGQDGQISFESLQETTDHLLLFIEYSDRADELILQMKERQII